MPDTSDQVLKAQDIGSIEDLLGAAQAARESGDLQAARRSYREALARYEEAGDEPSIARMHYELGRIAYDQDDREAAREHYATSLSLLQSLDDPVGAARAQRELGLLAEAEGDYETARSLLEASRSALEAAGDRVGAAYAVSGLGWAAQDQGDYGAARKLFEASLSALQSAGDDWGIARGHRDLAWNALDQGEYDLARKHAEQSLSLFESNGDPIAIAHSAYVLGRVLAEQDDASAARRLFERSLDMYQRADAQEGVARNLYRLGRLAEDGGNIDAAERNYDQSLQISERRDDQRGMANNMYRLGVIARQRGDRAEADRLFRRSRDAARAAGDADLAAEVDRALADLPDFNPARLEPSDPEFEREYRAQLELLDNPPELMLPEEASKVRIRVTNLGNRPWPASGPNAVWVGYQVEPDDPAGERPEPGRWLLDAGVEPGKSVEIMVPLTAPLKAGHYRVLWDTQYAVDHQWFSDRWAAEPETTPLEVVSLDVLLSRLDDLASQTPDERIALIELAAPAVEGADAATQEQLRDLIGRGLFDTTAGVAAAATHALHKLRAHDPTLDNWLRGLLAARPAEIGPIVELADSPDVEADTRAWLSDLLPAEPDVQSDASDEAAEVELKQAADLFDDAAVAEVELAQPVSPREAISQAKAASFDLDYRFKLEMRDSLPDMLLADEAISVELRIHNLGAGEWDVTGPNAVQIGYRAQPTDADRPAPLSRRRPLTEAPPPDGYADVAVPFTAPAEPGNYNVVWDLALRDADGWLSDHADAPTSLVEVVAESDLLSRLENLAAEDAYHRRVALLELAARAAASETDAGRRATLLETVRDALADPSFSVRRAAAYALYDLTRDDDALAQWLEDTLEPDAAQRDTLLELSEHAQVRQAVGDWLRSLLSADVVEGPAVAEGPTVEETLTMEAPERQEGPASAAQTPSAGVEAPEAAEPVEAADEERVVTGDGRASTQPAAEEVAAADAGPAPPVAGGDGASEPAVAGRAPDASPFRRDPPHVAATPAADEATRTVVEHIQTTIWNNVVRSAERAGADQFATDSRTLDIHIHPAYAEQVAAAAANLGDGGMAAGNDRRRFWVVLTLHERSDGQEQPLRYFEGPLKLEELSPTAYMEQGDADIGRQLHRALFHTELPYRYFTRDEPGTPTLRDGYARALEGATGADGLRIQLRIHTDAVELHHYPWEYLVDDTGQVRDPLACSSATPFARLLQVAGRGGQDAPTISRVRPLRILGALASPAELSWAGGPETELLAEMELEPIDLAEIEALTAGLDRFPLVAPLEGDNLLAGPTGRVSVAALRRRLQQAHEQQGAPFHVLHLLCHGFVGADGVTYLVLEQESGPRAALVSEAEFAELIRDFVPAGLRLVVLASCTTARLSQKHALQGVARRLVVEGVPAVIAMQHNVEFLAAQYFTQRLYPFLIHHGTVDRAVNAARREVWSRRRRSPRDVQPDRVGRFQWGISVLFTRLADGRLFHLDPAAQEASDPDAEPEIVPYADTPSGDVGRLVQRAVEAAGNQAGIAPNVDFTALAQAVAQALARPMTTPAATEPEPEDRRLFTSPGEARRRHALLSATSEYRRNHWRRTVLFVRRQARRRVADLLTPDSLAGLSAGEFRGDIWEGGGVDWPGDETPITELLGAGPPANLDPLHRLLRLSPSRWRTQHRGFQARDGTAVAPLRLRGNLTWQAEGRELAAGARPDTDDLRRLLYGDADTFDVFDELTSDPDRRTQGLDERIASLLLHAVAPDDYVPYHSALADRVLERLHLANDPEYSTGFRGFCTLARDLLADDDLGFEDLADVTYFLQRLAAGRVRWNEAQAGQARTRIALQPVNLRADYIDTGLVLNPGVLDQAVAALNAGKHLILIGPPGTGKTSLAEDLCRLARDGDCNRGHVLVTATADWTTFDTIGGYMPESGDRLVFRPGVFLDSIAAGKWLVIDEINRADIDKAFGELFTLLSGQAVTLPYRDAGRPVSIVPPGHPAPTGTRGYSIPASWRIVATMNVYDKASLFEMSYAFMRRFAFVDVTLPGSQPYQQLIRRFAVSAGLPVPEGDAVFSTLCELFDREPAGRANPLMQWRALGPAIAQDVVGYLVQRQPPGGDLDLSHLAEALLLYVVPQFDGLEPAQITDIYGHLTRAFADDKLTGFQDEELDRRRAALSARRKALLKRIEELFPFIGRDDWDAA